MKKILSFGLLLLSAPAWLQASSVEFAPRYALWKSIDLGDLPPNEEYQPQSEYIVTLSSGGQTGALLEIGPLSEGLAHFRVEDPETREPFSGYISSSGAVAIPVFRGQAYPFYEGRAAVNFDAPGSKIGYVDRKGRIAIAANYREASRFSGGVAWVRPAGEEPRWRLIDKKGKGLIWAKGLPRDFHEGLAAICDERDANCGFIDKRGRTLIARRYESVGDFSEGLAFAKANPHGGFRKLGFIDKKGAFRISFNQNDSYNNCRVEFSPFKGGISLGVLENKNIRIDRKGHILEQVGGDFNYCFERSPQD